MIILIWSKSFFSSMAGNDLLLVVLWRLIFERPLWYTHHLIIPKEVNALSHICYNYKEGVSMNGSIYPSIFMVWVLVWRPRYFWWVMDIKNLTCFKFWIPIGYAYHFSTCYKMQYMILYIDLGSLINENIMFAL